jgi:branched-chain amino acid aminotransferase
MKVWMRGIVLEESAAQVSVLDHGLLYGDGVFEGIRILGGKIGDLERHLARLATSARAIYLELPLGLAALERVVLETAAAYGKAEAYVRLLVTRGVGRLGIDVASCALPEVLCLVDGIDLFGGPARSGLRLVTASLRRPDPDVLDPRVKSLNYLNNVINRYEAKERGGDEALVLNRRGHVAEASVANVFVRHQDRLFTPPVTDGALDGITRGRVLKLAPELGLRAEERTLSRVDLLAADEVFLTGSGAGFVPVLSLDGQLIPVSEDAAVWALEAQNRRYVEAFGTPITGADGAAIALDAASSHAEP